MHAAAMDWVSRFATDQQLAVLDIGGRNINGSPRHLFPKAVYRVLDKVAAPDVDLIEDAAYWKPEAVFQLVLALEVFEHTADWPEICGTAYKALKPGGRFVVTCAGPGRLPHSGYDGAAVRPDEFYANVDPDELDGVLEACGFTEIVIDQVPTDVRAVAVKPKES